MPRRELDCRQREQNLVLLGAVLDDYMQLDSSDPQTMEKEVRMPRIL